MADTDSSGSELTFSRKPTSAHGRFNAAVPLPTDAPPLSVGNMVYFLRKASEMPLAYPNQKKPYLMALWSDLGIMLDANDLAFLGADLSALPSTLPALTALSNNMLAHVRQSVAAENDALREHWGRDNPATAAALKQNHAVADTIASHLSEAVTKIQRSIEARPRGREVGHRLVGVSDDLPLAVLQGVGRELRGFYFNYGDHPRFQAAMNEAAGTTLGLAFGQANGAVDPSGSPTIPLDKTGIFDADALPTTRTMLTQKLEAFAQNVADAAQARITQLEADAEMDPAQARYLIEENKRWAADTANAVHNIERGVARQLRQLGSPAR